MCTLPFQLKVSWGWCHLQFAKAFKHLKRTKSSSFFPWAKAAFPNGSANSVQAVNGEERRTSLLKRCLVISPCFLGKSFNFDNKRCYFGWKLFFNVFVWHRNRGITLAFLCTGWPISGYSQTWPSLTQHTSMHAYLYGGFWVVSVVKIRLPV